MSNNALQLASYTLDGGQVLTADTVKNYLVNGGGNVSDQEVLMFIELCKAQGLNPFARDAYLIKYKSKNPQFDTPATTIVGKDFFIKKANENPAFEGMKAGIVVVDKENQIHEREGSLKLPGETIVGGWCEVYRSDRKVPTKAIVAYEEYVQKKGNGEVNSMWTSKPGTMIRKVAQSQALREAFPNELRGLYQQEEMGIDGKLPQKPIEPGMASAEQKNKIMAMAKQRGLFDFNDMKNTKELEYFCTSNGYDLKNLKFEEAEEVLQLLIEYDPKLDTNFEDEVQDVEFTEVAESTETNTEEQVSLL
ncbi:MAG TPA: phage recombination protein Bet [Terrisporobacter glycolicus]|uniref:phage recombination protein Bet n=1 Tax=Terrisporobacter TaxID=1505652 RepID=UPI000E89961A|nr:MULTISPECIES: phage recombination protein Bet [Terrisporobacter]HBI93664.1 phage recombination protein Bet [Terrisporobacter hibernicus]